MKLPSLSTSLDLHLVVAGNDTLPVRARLEYDAADPFAVRATFQVPRTPSPVCWVFARDLLVDGLTGPAGAGDVGVWPSTSEGQDIVCLSLTAPGGHALLQTPRAELQGFVDAMLDAVPPGRETAHLDMDAELAALLD